MMSGMAGTKFELGTAVERRDDGAGAYRADVGEEWNCPVVPHGGLMTATTVRAMTAELDEPDQTLRSVTTVFAAQVPAGPVDIDVTVLRRGRSVSQLSATARTPGRRRRAHDASPCSARPRDGFSFTDSVPPIVPPPDECPSFRDPLPEGFERDFHMNFWDYIEGRPASGHPPWEPYVPTSSERSAWYRFDEPPMLDDGRLDPLAILTMCDTMPGAVERAHGPTRSAVPAAELRPHRAPARRRAHRVDARRSTARATPVTATRRPRWRSGTRRATHLVAYATQQMFFVFPDGPPPPEERVPIT